MVTRKILSIFENGRCVINSEELLIEMLEFLLTDNFILKVWGNCSEEHYKYVDISGRGETVREIHIRKTSHQSSIAFNKDCSPKSVATYVKESSDFVRDLILLSHEYGHSFSPDKNLTLTYTKAENGPVTSEERQAILNEENFAWDKGEQFLSGTDFSEWVAFHLIKEESLKTYLNIRVVS